MAAKKAISLYSPIGTAAARGQADKVAKLLRAGALVGDTDSSAGSTPLLLASYPGRYEVMVLLLENGADVNAQNLNGYTPLMASSHAGHNRIVNLLLQHGATLNLTTNEGMTALHFAVSHSENPETAALLLDAGADINARKNSGYTPLMSVAFWGGRNSTAKAELLVARGADVNVVTEAGINALIIAEQRGNIEVAELLMRPSAPRALCWK